MESLYNVLFPTVEEARAAIDAVCLPLGCSLVKNRTRPNLLELRCCKGRKFRSQRNENLPPSKHRETTSQMTGCPYRLVIFRHSFLSSWRIRRSRNETANTHNHEVLPPTAISRLRNIVIENRKAQIMSLYKLGLKPIQILKHLQEIDSDPGIQALTRNDIYNMIRKHNQQQQQQAQQQKQQEQQQQQQQQQEQQQEEGEQEEEDNDEQTA
ncbi:hypothetical protein ACQKWADRAFT_178919 [Trichoderma austrokoningii]